ncbi:MAG: ATP-binding protein [Clostridia bacterium]
MINIIYGAKGSGKTKTIIELANKGVTDHLGDIVFITDTSRYIHDIKYQIRFTNTKESNIRSEDGLIGFLQGMMEANYDIRFMYIDGAARMIGKELHQMQNFFKRLETISQKTEMTFFLTVSSDYDTLPAFIKSYIKE